MWFTIVDGLMRGIAALIALAGLCFFGVLAWRFPSVSVIAIGLPLSLPFAYLLVAMVRPQWTAPIGQAIRNSVAKFRNAVVRPYVTQPLDRVADCVEGGGVYVGRGLGWAGVRLWKVAAPVLMVLAGLVILALLIVAGIAIFHGVAALPVSVAVIIGALIIASALGNRR